MEGRIHPPSHELGCKILPKRLRQSHIFILRLPKFGCKDTKKLRISCIFCAEFIIFALSLQINRATFDAERLTIDNNKQ